MKTKLTVISQFVFLAIVLVMYQNCAPVQNSDLTDQSTLNSVNANSEVSPVKDPEVVVNTQPKDPEVVVNTQPKDPEVVVNTQPKDPEVVVNTEPKDPEVVVNTQPKDPTEVNTCSVHISNMGSNANSGSLNQPVKDVSFAISKIKNSGTVCFLAGSYSPIKLQSINAPINEPLVLKVHSKSKGKVFIVGSDVSRGFGIVVYTSKNIFVEGFSIKNLQKGVAYYSVIGGGISNNKIERIGLEGIHVGALFDYNTRKFVGGPSSNIKVVGNSINGTGYQYIDGKRHDYGEGIYIGTGAKSGDYTNHILVKDNFVQDTSAEAIEVKPDTQYIDIIENTVENINLQYSAAITIAVSSSSAQNSHCKVIGNIVKKVRTRKHSVAGIVVGNGTTEVTGNTVSDVEGGRAIRVLKAFHNANARKVIIKNNTIYGGRLAIHDGDAGYPGMTGVVEASDNIIKP